MQELETSKRIFEGIEIFTEQVEEIKDEVKREEVKLKLEKLFELALEIEEHEKKINDLEEKAEKVSENIFEDLSAEEKIEMEDTISAHLKRALELLVEKGKNRMSKAKASFMKLHDTISGRYDDEIELVEEEIEEKKSWLERRREERKQLKEKAIEQLKTLEGDDIAISEYATERDEVADLVNGKYEEKENMEQNIKSVNKNAKALIKYEKKGFFSRFISNFSELGKTEELSEEQKMAMLQNGEVPKKLGFFSKMKQAFSKTREQGKEIQGKNDALKERIMSKLDSELEEKNKEINELENILAQNDEKRLALESEKKEKLNQIIKDGKLKLKDLQEMIDNEVVKCSNPRMAIAHARVSTLKDKLARVFSWAKPKEEEKEVEENGFRAPTEEDLENKTSRNSGMDR